MEDLKLEDVFESKAAIEAYKNLVKVISESHNGQVMPIHQAQTFVSGMKYYIEMTRTIASAVKTEAEFSKAITEVNGAIEVALEKITEELLETLNIQVPGETMH
jgi:hypothetical protein